MSDEAKVETTQAGGNATGAPVETPPPAVPATTPKTYTEDDVKAAREEARREAQSSAQKAEAKLHRQYQEQLAAAQQKGRSQARQVLAQAGVKDADNIANALDVYEMAEYGRQVMQQQQQAQAWSQYVAEQATVAGLDPTDPRIQGATSYTDLAQKIISAVKADERAALAAEREAAKKREADALQREAEAGKFDTLGASPAGAITEQSLLQEYRSKLKSVQGNVDKIVALKREYRRKGLSDI